jgi:hypothetical protein
MNRRALFAAGLALALVAAQPAQAFVASLMGNAARAGASLKGALDSRQNDGDPRDTTGMSMGERRAYARSMGLADGEMGRRTTTGWRTDAEREAYFEGLEDGIERKVDRELNDKERERLEREKRDSRREISATGSDALDRGGIGGPKGAAPGDIGRGTGGD